MFEQILIAAEYQARYQVWLKVINAVRKNSGVFAKSDSRETRAYWRRAAGV